MRPNKRILAIFMALFLVACASQSADTIPGTSTTDTDTTRVEPTPAPPPPPVMSEPEPEMAFDPSRDRVIYFDFDKSDIRPEFRDIIKAHAERLAGDSSMRYTLEGHADERGSREYNIGLGDRRAQQVRRLMLFYGATDRQIRTISYGEERPIAKGSNEEAWALNRRVELSF